jgi:branched-chain amino acid transport system substrate-binding protein
MNYAFKIIPSEVDVARGPMRWLTSQNVGSIAIVAAADTFPHASAIAMAKAAPDAGIRVTDEETVDKKGLTTLAPFWTSSRLAHPIRR